MIFDFFFRERKQSDQKYHDFIQEYAWITKLNKKKVIQSNEMDAEEKWIKKKTRTETPDFHDETRTAP